LYFGNSLAAVFKEPVLGILLTFQFPNLMTVFSTIHPNPRTFLILFYGIEVKGCRPSATVIEHTIFGASPPPRPHLLPPPQTTGCGDAFAVVTRDPLYRIWIQV
jgi:hypothetical protein